MAKDIYEYYYCFPYYCFTSEDRIIIYGAGGAGQAFYKELLQTQFLKVEMIVDEVKREIDDGRIKVHNPNEIVNHEYDYILVAVINKSTAEQIIDNLIKMGVDRNKIIWEGDYYNLFIAYNHTAKKKSKILDSVLKTNKKKIYLMSLFEGGNYGDFAISEGEYRWIDRYFSDYTLVKVSARDYDAIESTVKSVVKEQDIIFFSGGGNFGDLWEGHRNMYRISQALPQNIKFLLPNNFAYKETDEKEKNILGDLEKCYQCENLYLVYRDSISYEFCKNSVMKDRVFYYPDMAMLLNYSDKKLARNGKVLICLRVDEEKRYDIKDDIVEIVSNMGLEYEVTDTYIETIIELEEGTAEFEKYIEFYRKYSMVITDRLHGMIFAAITGTPCVAVDNLTRKVGSVYRWIEDISNIMYKEDGVITAEDIREVYTKGTVNYENDLIWNKMKDLELCIRRIVRE
jgi:pyruvyl transferase EpsI